MPLEPPRPARPHRALLLLHGARADTHAQASLLLSRLDPTRVLWVGGGAGDTPPRQVARHLGRSLDAVCFSVHHGLDVDALAQAQGLVVGGGVLVLCLPPPGGRPAPRAALAVHPHGLEAVGAHLYRRLARIAADARSPLPPRPVPPPPPITSGTADQRAAVDAIVAAWSASDPTAVVLKAARGRGKSATLGLALARWMASGGGPAWVAAADRGGLDAICRFAGAAPVERTAPGALLRRAGLEGVLIIDEAARLPVPVLQRIAQRHPRAHVAFATTTEGYEGTGRGFVLRFEEWLQRQERPVLRPVLGEPIRWGPGDPVEDVVRRALAMDARPAPVTAPIDPRAVRVDRVPAGALAQDEELLRAAFGLLLHAHYRTTPGDLHRLLDAPNLHCLVARVEGQVVGVNLVAIEGGFGVEESAAYARGEGRMVGQALADSLVAHLGVAEAGALRLARSVRIATHPRVRRAGIARRLVAYAHETFDVDVFGTVFGATSGVLRFRQRLGYGLVRLGAGRGARTGAPSVVMATARSDRGAAILRQARAELPHNLPLQLRLLQADPELGLDAALAEVVRGLAPTPGGPPAPEQIDRALAGYLDGPRTSDSVAFALRFVARAQGARIADLPPPDAALLRSRVLELQAWDRCAAAAGLPTARAAQRRLKRVIRGLVTPG